MVKILPAITNVIFPKYKIQTTSGGNHSTLGIILGKHYLLNYWTSSNDTHTHLALQGRDKWLFRYKQWHLHNTPHPPMREFLHLWTGSWLCQRRQERPHRPTDREVSTRRNSPGSGQAEEEWHALAEEKAKGEKSIVIGQHAEEISMTRQVDSLSDKLTLQSD